MHGSHTTTDDIEITQRREAFRDRIAAGARALEGSAMIRSRIGLGPYESEHPLHHAAVDTNALRCELHALAKHVPEIEVVAKVLDVAADTLDDYCEAVGL